MEGFFGNSVYWLYYLHISRDSVSPVSGIYLLIDILGFTFSCFFLVFYVATFRSQYQPGVVYRSSFVQVCTAIKANI